MESLSCGSFDHLPHNQWVSDFRGICLSSAPQTGLTGSKSQTGQPASPPASSTSTMYGRCSPLRPHFLELLIVRAQAGTFPYPNCPANCGQLIISGPASPGCFLFSLRKKEDTLSDHLSSFRTRKINPPPPIFPLPDSSILGFLFSFPRALGAIIH